MTVYRFVHTDDLSDPELRNEFLGDRESWELRGKNYDPTDREIEFPILQEGMSVWGSREFMQARWARISARAAARGDAVEIGDFIADVNLVPGQGCHIEDLGEEGQHMTLWGDPDRLVQVVQPITPAAA